MHQLYTKQNPLANHASSVGGHLLSNLGYADDITSVIDLSQECRNLPTHLPKNSEEVGLIINMSKTKYMASNKYNACFIIIVYGEQIQKVTEFVYLGYKL